MKKNIFFAGILMTGILFSTNSFSQKATPHGKKTEEIIIRKNGDKTTKMTVEINGDSVTVNGKPLSDYHDGDVSILQRDLMNRDSHNFLYAPDNEKMDIDILKNETINSKPHTFLGVLTGKSDEGVKITEVIKGSGAEKAGLQTGDIITKLDDKKITSPEDLMDAVKSHKPGDEVKIYYLRNNKKKDTEAKLGETKENKRTFIFKGDNPGMNGNDFNFKMPPMPDMNGMPNGAFKFLYNNNKPRLGVKIEDTENNNGVTILKVEEGSPADKAGLKKDDIITQVNGEKVNNVGEAREQLGKSEDKQNVDIKALRNNSEMNFEVKIPKQLNKADL